MIDISVDSLGVPPAAENVKLLEYSLGGHEFSGFISESDGGLYVIKADVPNGKKLAIHTLNITPDDPVVVEMIENMTFK